MSSTQTDQGKRGKRVRLSREDRGRQLLEVAWNVAREEGSDALTLPRLADAAGVTKPVIYDHFGTRNGLLKALYQDFDNRQTAIIDQALDDCPPSLEAIATVIASSYVDCVLAQGREIPGVLAGLAGSPELEDVKYRYKLAFIDKCNKALAPFADKHEIPRSRFWAMVGAADSLSHAAARDITPHEAKMELRRAILSMVAGSGQGDDA